MASKRTRFKVTTISGKTPELNYDLFLKYLWGKVIPRYSDSDSETTAIKMEHRLSNIVGIDQQKYNLGVFLCLKCGMRHSMDVVTCSVCGAAGSITFEPADLLREIKNSVSYYSEYWLYRSKLVEVAWSDSNLSEEEKSTRVMHAVLKEEKAFEKIKREVSEFKEFEKKQPKRRAAISDDVRMFVWKRDEGACVVCGSNENLEFDHIIPVSKGGSSSERNLQLLCEGCNREKGANI